ncbi:hypothetical protein JDV02_008812 [Purpureocillium takamizusanense]|uniref:Uncharacterized protein n=1 Tax=Purpureocillium takamizusanense TaxID=2060973 RepID=A0A9Q8VDN4_9HYPO|nr:uncharacterized protein JDV02_008812 [Purpureocillium takamizusanense]UNI22970.1 hypothetical protein JDV02_008812 [Purpureocillium takamizusanense]
MTRRPVRSSASRLVPRTYTLQAASSATTTPMSSAYPSTNNSEAEADDEVAKISLASLTLDTPLVPLRHARRVPKKPFPFLSLPSELRVKVYQHFFAGTDPVLDLSPDNYKRIHKHLGLLRVCRLIRAEATHFFYSTRSFRLFPTYPGRYFKSKRPLLARLKPGLRECITTLELRLGPGWNAPPRGWVVNDALGLKDCVSVRKLSVFVECDPSDGFYKGFRRSEGFYEGFSRQLLGSVIDALPHLAVIEFDGFSGVKKSGAMMHGLLDVAAQSGHLIRWGPEHGWTDADEDEEPPKAGASEKSAALYLNGLAMQGYAQNMPVAAS